MIDRLPAGIDAPMNGPSHKGCWGDHIGTHSRWECGDPEASDVGLCVRCYPLIVGP